MTFARKCWLGASILLLAWCSIVYWCLWINKPAMVPVLTYREVDVSHMQGKKAEPGKSPPAETK
jgi:hypothetical protein